ncbi:MAG: DUF2284 domain-containing protein [Anaerovoracaceae bacterium]
MSKQEKNKKLQAELVALALEMGAKKAKVFDIKDVAFDERTFLKCLFGCDGGFPFCPSHKDEINVKFYIDMVKKYKYGIMIETDSVKLGQDISIALERKAFLADNVFALAATECEACSDCQYGKTGVCADIKKVRLPLYAFGINVYKTVRAIGWELEVVQKKGDPEKNICAVFVD